MKSKSHRKALQVVLATLALAPLLSGLLGLYGIYNPIFAEKLPENLILDSNLRFLNAMCVAIAIAIYLIIPVIEKETFARRVICGSLFLGGVGRLISIYDLGAPPIPLLFFLGLELTSPILIIYWQHQVAKHAISEPHGS